MSILRAQGCVSRIEQDIVNDFTKNPSVQNRGKTWKIDTGNSLVSLVAKFKVSNGTGCELEDKWLAVNIVFPGITVNAYRNAPLLLRPHCSFFMKSGSDVGAALKATSEELPLNFWAANQKWFDENKFVDVLFGFKEHGWNGILPIVRTGNAKEMHYRPTRLFNVSEVGWLTDKVIEFIRMWCDV